MYGWQLRVIKDAFSDFNQIFAIRLAEANHFYADIQQRVKDEDLKRIQRQAFAGMMWCKQFYYYHVEKWLQGRPGGFPHT